MRFVAEGGAVVMELTPVVVKDIAAMMEKYPDLPMELADATLVWPAAKARIGEVVTSDETDFGIDCLPVGGRLIKLLNRA